MTGVQTCALPISVYVGRQIGNERNRGEVVAVDAATGNIQWSLAVGNVLGTPVISGTAVICTTTERIVAVDLVERTEVWTKNRPHHGYERLLIDGAGHLWLGGDARGHVMISRLDGRTGKVIYAANLDAQTQALKLPRLSIIRKGGHSAWRFDASEPWTTGGKTSTVGGTQMPIPAEGRVYAMTSSGAIIALDVPEAVPPAKSGHSWIPVANG